jgi:poly-gamma-glutamate capsule biosynthesis protein CapA/YwtB (metallophosphatase superfamily)
MTRLFRRDERIHTTVPRQRRLSRAAAQAGAKVVLGAHPHVLQPIDRGRHRLIAWSLGNFVWSPPTYATSLTGVLHLGLSTRGVERARLQRGRIIGSQPRLGN